MTYAGEQAVPAGDERRHVRLTRRGRLAVAAGIGLVVLAVGGWLLGPAGPLDPAGTGRTGGAGSPGAAASSGPHATSRPTGRPTPVLLDWEIHRERKLAAWLAVPSAYRTVVHDDGDATYRHRGSRIVEYVVPGSDTARLRLTSYAARPRPVTAWAAREAGQLQEYWPDAEVRHSRTRFHGRDAVLLDTTYTFDPQSRARTRRLQLLVEAGRGRFYDLYVEMPKGGADERVGAEVFRGARDRLRLAGVNATSQDVRPRRPA